MRDISIIIQCVIFFTNKRLINDFRTCVSIILDSLHRTYCMHMEGCE